jgi:hypothetical protein
MIAHLSKFFTTLVKDMPLSYWLLEPDGRDATVFLTVMLCCLIWYIYLGLSYRRSPARASSESDSPSTPMLVKIKRAVGYLALPHQEIIRHIHRSVKPLSYAADLRHPSRRTSFHPHGTRPGRKGIHTSPQGLSAHTPTPGSQLCGLGEERAV